MEQLVDQFININLIKFNPLNFKGVFWCATGSRTYVIYT